MRSRFSIYKKEAPDELNDPKSPVSPPPLYAEKAEDEGPQQLDSIEVHAVLHLDSTPVYELAGLETHRDL